MYYFYARQHGYAIVRICYRPSVHLSVRLSHGWIIQKRLCMLKNCFSQERFATFANDRVITPQRMPNDGRMTTGIYQRFPKNRKTLGVRWLKRHGVTAPLATIAS